ncbi:MAG: hypothetical protein ACKO54_15965 [Alphaproteobacteria bacterium]
MPSDPLLSTLVAAVDWLMPVTFASVWWVLWRSRAEGPAAWQLAVPLLVAFGWGVLWAFVPALAALRLNPPPGGQAGAILALFLGLIGLLALPAARRFFRTARLANLVALGPWRFVYGALILAIGVNGGLPPSFFWSVGIVDILVGLWACAILLAVRDISTPHLVAWNVAGAIDLTHVLVLGALHLRDFFLADPGIPALNLLPLAGVPLFLAIHVLTIWGLSQSNRGRTARA